MWRLRQQRWLLLQLLLYRLDVEWCGRQAAWGRRADAAGAAAAKSCARKRLNNECKRRQFSMHVIVRRQSALLPPPQEAEPERQAGQHVMADWHHHSLAALRLHVCCTHSKLLPCISSLASELMLRIASVHSRFNCNCC
jgi:hypothetical protein